MLGVLDLKVIISVLLRFVDEGNVFLNFFLIFLLKSCESNFVVPESAYTSE